MPITDYSTTYYPHYDQVGSLRAITDSSGTVIKQIDYDSFGNIISDTNTSMTVPFGFAGGMYDYDTGLTRFGFRDYDPSIGRWTAKDPIDFAGGDENLFGYAHSDPVNFIDSLGLTELDVAVAIEIVRRTQPDLRFPSRVIPYSFSGDYVGEYRYFGDYIRLHEKYYKKKLCDTEAEELLDTIIHEVLHANDSPFKQSHDTYNPHPDIGKEAQRRTSERISQFLKERDPFFQHEK
jgi:RHS repeat-associated protein